MNYIYKFETNHFILLLLLYINKYIINYFILYFIFDLVDFKHSTVSTIHQPIIFFRVK